MQLSSHLKWEHGQPNLTFGRAGKQHGLMEGAELGPRSLPSVPGSDTDSRREPGWSRHHCLLKCLCSTPTRWDPPLSWGLTTTAGQNFLPRAHGKAPTGENDGACSMGLLLNWQMPLPGGGCHYLSGSAQVCTGRHHFCHPLQGKRITVRHCKADNCDVPKPLHERDRPLPLPLH